MLSSCINNRQNKFNIPLFPTDKHLSPHSKLWIQCLVAPNRDLFDVNVSLNAPSVCFLHKTRHIKHWRVMKATLSFTEVKEVYISVPLIWFPLTVLDSTADCQSFLFVYMNTVLYSDKTAVELFFFGITRCLSGQRLYTQTAVSSPMSAHVRWHIQRVHNCRVTPSGKITIHNSKSIDKLVLYELFYLNTTSRKGTLH